MLLHRLLATANKEGSNAACAFLCLACFLLVSVGRLAALDPTFRISQYGHTSWRIQDGYFGGQPISITQTTDGYLWIGTSNGVLRFDGVEFVPWTSLSGDKLPSADVHAVLGAKDGSLWIATENGVVQWVDHRSTEFLNGHELNALLQDKKGAIWVTRSGSGSHALPLCRISGADVHCFSYGVGDGAGLSAAIGLAEDTSGYLWVGHDTAAVRWNSVPTEIYRPNALRSHQGTGGVVAFAAAPDGSVWVGVDTPGHGGGLQHIVNGAMKPFAVPKLNGETLEVEALLIDRQGNLWVGTGNQGVYRIHGSEVDHFGSADGLSGDYVNQIFEDREGNLWFANSNGMDMLRDLRVATFTKREGISEDVVESVLAARDGTVWIGSNHLQALVHGSISPELGKSLPGNFVTCLLEDHTGRLWVGMNNTLWVHDGGNKNGTFRQIKRKDGSPIGTVRGLTEDSDHNIWVQTNGPPATLLRLQNLEIQEELQEPPLPRAFRLASDPKSGIWLGLVNSKNGSSLARLRSGKVELAGSVGRPESTIHAIFKAPDGSILGATDDAGIVGWKDGKQHILSVRNGLPCDKVYAINVDDQANLWLYAGCGLIAISKDEVQRWWQEPEPKLRFRLFDALDGVQAGQSHFSGSSKGPDGRLWFANNSVAQTIDPAHMEGNTLAPPVYITGVVADRKSSPPQEGLRLPALTHDLEIDYTALSFSAPKKVMFRYMLEGRDTSWQEPGTRRQAFYNDLRPRKYRFRVVACNNDGVWNEVGASLNFSIAPAYYQTAWFGVLCGVALVLLLWGLYQRRLWQVQRRFDASLAERARIVEELRKVIDSIPGFVCAMNPDGEVVLLNRPLLDYFGRTFEEMRGGWATNESIHPEDRARSLEVFKHSIKTGTPHEYEQRYLRADGVYRWFRRSARPMRDAEGRITGWYALMTDIEDRKRAQVELQRNEAFLAEGQQLSSTGTFSWSLDKDEVVVSEEARRIFDFGTNEPVTLERIGERIHPDDAGMFSERMGQARDLGDDQDYEIRLRLAGGIVKYVHVTSKASRHEDGRLEYIGAIQDVTERRFAEEALNQLRSELAHMARVTSLGALTASITHEISQPLSGIVTNASICVRTLSAGAPNIDSAQEAARRIIRDGNRASDVITRLRALFSKKGSTADVVDLNEAVREVIALCSDDMARNRVILRQELANDLPRILGDRVQLQQVILNLLRNGSDAMQSVDDRPREMVIRTEVGGDGCVQLTVQDTGVGITPQGIEKLFEAFYTTKDEGMGMGLSISRSIIDRHHGRLWATPNDGPGATFSFSIPCVTNTP